MAIGWVDDRAEAGPLAAWFERSGMTQAALAEALGVTQGQVSAWASGRRLPRPETLIRLSDLTGIPVEALVRFALDARMVDGAGALSAD